MHVGLSARAHSLRFRGGFKTALPVLAAATGTATAVPLALPVDAASKNTKTHNKRRMFANVGAGAGGGGGGDDSGGDGYHLRVSTPPPDGSFIRLVRWRARARRARSAF